MISFSNNLSLSTVACLVRLTLPTSLEKDVATKTVRFQLVFSVDTRDINTYSQIGGRTNQKIAREDNKEDDDGKRRDGSAQVYSLGRYIR